MKVITCETAGFCFGVDRAVKLVSGLAESDEKVCTLGPIIHNPQIVGELASKGVRIIDDPSECEIGEKIVLRSHGVEKHVIDYIEKNNIPYKNATCPFVLRIVKIVKEKSINNDCVVIITGDKFHPEVKAISSYCENDYFVVKSVQEIINILAENGNFAKKNVVLVSQTTFNKEIYKKCVEIVKKVCTKADIFDTICSATALRQHEALELSKKCDAMIVVGGKNSSNTTKLKEICSEFTKTFLIESANELNINDFVGCSTIGLTAGASTPAWIIKEVQTTMSEFVNDVDGDDISFEEALELTLKSVHTGDRVKGVVTAVAPTEVQVEIGTKHAGYIPLNELTDDPNKTPDDIVKKGDEIELIVTRVNDQEGTVTLSKKRLDAIAGYDKVCEAAETGEILQGVVTEVVRGGVIAVTSGTKVFIPASQATASRNEPLEDLLKKNVSFKIIEVNKNRRRSVGSIRLVLKEQRKELQDKFWETVQVGDKFKGEVKSLTNYGAFVDLGGVDGMIHISELSWSRIKHPSEILKVGDIADVYIKDLDRENKKISLGFKRAEDNPWEVLKRDYKIGDIVKAKIVSMTSFGAFANILPGIDGLIHISQISKQHVEKPQDVLSIGEEVDVVITDVDFDKKRISLSMRAVTDQPAQSDLDDEMSPIEEAGDETVVYEAGPDGATGINVDEE